eukprot:SAG31_NODE_3119_length_4656_cov_3.057055_5_plen_239_part_00
MLQHHLSELRENVTAVRTAVCRTGDAASLSRVNSEVALLAGTLDHIHDRHVERGTSFRRWRPVQPIRLSEERAEDATVTPATEPIQVPWGIVVAVTVDGGVDGFLIGLAFIAKPEAGILMALATCLEMGFLGISYSATLGNALAAHRQLHAALALVPPLVLVLAAALPGLFGDIQKDSPVAYLALISFSIVALLFLVTQELLAEAAEAAADAAWYVPIWIFVGVYSVIIIERSLEGGE